MSSSPAPSASPVVVDAPTIEPSVAEPTPTSTAAASSEPSELPVSSELPEPSEPSNSVSLPESSPPALPESSPPASPASPASPPPKASLLPKSLRFKSLKSPSIPPAAAKTAAGLDAFIVHLDKCMQTPAGTDAVLAIVCYAARLGSVLLNTAAGRALLHEPVYRMVAVVFAARPSIRSILVQPIGSALLSSSSLKTDAAAAALVLAKRLRALGSLLTEARMMLRLWGLLSLYVWARALLKQLLAKRRAAAKAKEAPNAQESKETQEAGSDGVSSAATAAAAAPSTVQSLIGWTQLLSCIGYQVTENYAYLSSKGVLGASPATQASMYMWSSRAFSVYVAVELARGAYDIVHHGVSDTPAKKAAAVELHRNFTRYAFLAPAMGHWSVQKGFMSEAGLTVCGFIPAALQIHKVWQDA